MSYENASNKQVLAFLDFLVYGDGQKQQIASAECARTYSTLTGYIGAITDFYRWLDQTYGSEMEFYETDRRCRTQSYLYGQIYNYQYKKLINRVIPDTKGRRAYLKWYTPEEKESLCAGFQTLRDEAVFRLTLEGFRIDEVLSMRLQDYRAAERLTQPSRSKRRQTAVDGYENQLRVVRISEETAATLNRYLFEERPTAENTSGLISDWIFLNLRGASVGTPLAYPNYRKILKACTARCGLDDKKIRTHSGRSTRVMEVLEENALYPDAAKSELQIKHLFGWSSIDSITPYTNYNNEILAHEAYLRHKRGGDGDD